MEILRSVDNAYHHHFTPLIAMLVRLTKCDLNIPMAINTAPSPVTRKDKRGWYWCHGGLQAVAQNTASPSDDTMQSQERFTVENRKFGVPFKD
jgi:hypothetical protein